MNAAPLTLLLPDGSPREIAAGTTPRQAIESIGAGLARATVGAKLDDRWVPLDEPLKQGGQFEVITKSDPRALYVLRHSTAHLMAYAVQQLFPGAVFGFGPPVEDGFYYDIQLDRALTTEDLEAIEARMKDLAKEGFSIERERIGKDDIAHRFEGQPLKVEQAEMLEAQGEELSIYRMGEFQDLCEGPHVGSTKEIKAFKLMSIAGAYWRGDEKREQLQRIYGTSWFDKKDLKAHLHRLEEAKKRDHRRLGGQLDLYGIQEEAGGGLAFYYPKGSALRNVLVDYWKEVHRRAGYQLVDTPQISKGDLWHTSGHMQFYRENMYTFETEGQEYVVKPMNCPGHVLIYKRKLWSYREMPVRYAELGTVHRYERSGTLHGMLRVRGFTQDDAHIFCMPEQLVDEVRGVLKLLRKILGACGFTEYEVELSVRDPEDKAKYAGEDHEWEAAEASLVEALELEGFEHTRMEGEAVFYGPKIDIKLVDAIGRKWQTSTVQFDFNLPRRFGVEYVDNEGNRQHPYMVHRAIYGSLERFIGVLTEHFAGVFPLWLAPVQAKILPVAADFAPYARELQERLMAKGLRIEADLREEKIGKKIREAEMERVPLMLVVGGREVENSQVSLRRHGGEDGGTLGLDELERLLLDESALPY